MTSATWKIKQGDEKEIEKDFSVEGTFALNQRGLSQ